MKSIGKCLYSVLAVASFETELIVNLKYLKLNYFTVLLRDLWAKRLGEFKETYSLTLNSYVSQLIKVNITGRSKRGPDPKPKPNPEENDNNNQYLLLGEDE